MKIKLYLTNILNSLLREIKRFPVELTLLLFTFILCATEEVENYLPAITPLFVAFAYILNMTFKRATPWRYLYYFSWLPLIPLLFIDNPPWVESAIYFTTLLILFLGVFLCRGRESNRSFVSEILQLIKYSFVSLVLTSVALLLLYGIYFSIIYIFFGNAYNDDFYLYSAEFTYIVLTPMLTLAMLNSSIEGVFKHSRLFDVLVNYIITPALLIYTTILAIYSLKILFTWSLPQGKLSYMVFGFIIATLAVKAVQPLLSKRYYDWFFNRVGLITIPALLLFWLGVLYRVTEYGLSEFRVYLLICGVIMTFAVVVFTLKESRGVPYRCIVYLAIVLFAIVGYIPAISAENISIYSQKIRVHKLLSKMDLLDDNGVVKREGIDKYVAIDNETYKEYDKIHASLRYLSSEEALPLFGLESEYDFYALYMKNGYDYKDSTTWIYLRDDGYSELDISDYGYYYDIYSHYSKSGSALAMSICEAEMKDMDTAEPLLIVFERVPDKLVDSQDRVGDATADSRSEPRELELDKGVIVRLEISLNQLLATQFAKLGFGADNVPTIEQIEGASAEMKLYCTDDYMILFDNMNLSKREQSGLANYGYKIEHVNLKTIITKRRFGE